MTLLHSVCVLFPYRLGGQVEFRDVHSLNSITQEYSSFFHVPYKLCQAGPTTLQYSGKFRGVVRWLDCSYSTPQATNQELLIPKAEVFDMCLVNLQDTKRVVIADHKSDAVQCFNVEGSKLEWSVLGDLSGMKEKMGPRGLATDGQGHLFVSDVKNKCIQKFTVAGKYLGVFIKEGEQGLGEPGHLDWSDTLSSLVVQHGRHNKISISVINVMQL